MNTRLTALQMQKERDMAELKRREPEAPLEWVVFEATTGPKTGWIKERDGVPFARFYDGDYSISTGYDMNDFDAEHRLDVLERAFESVNPDDSQALDEGGGNIGHLSADDGTITYTARCGGERYISRAEVADTLAILRGIADRIAGADGPGQVAATQEA